VKYSPNRLSWTIAGSLLMAIGAGCAGVKTPVGGSGGNGGTPVGGGLGGHGVVQMKCNGPNGLCTDFPTDPIVDPGVATNICAAPAGSGGPCILEPEDGSLFPSNWLRPRVSVQGLSGPMKITVHSDKETNDLVVYTASNTWTMPKDIWSNLASHVQDSEITVSVCGTSGGKSTNRFTIAPASASGSMVFWAANPSSADLDQHACQTSLTGPCLTAAQLLGFSVGDETTEPVLTIGQVKQASRTDSGNPAPVTCIGCHSATPDKGFVTFADSYPWRTASASVQGAAAASPSGNAFPSVTPGGLAALLQPGWGPFSFSLNKADTNPYWQAGMRIGVGSLGLDNPLVPDYGNHPDQNDSPHLAWFNLEAPVAHVMQPGDNGNWAYASFAAGAGISSGNSLGFIEHTGDLCGGFPCGAGMPSWSHDGSKIVYVSTNAALSGRFNREVPGPASDPNPALNATNQTYNPLRGSGMTNLFTVPFNGGLGGAATAVNGAATPDNEEYYPAYSPDDAFIAYTRVAGGQSMYANPNAELYVVPSGGGTATRLVANNPPACSGKASPGVNNHWAKWSPEVPAGPRGKYYWMIFSSNRADIAPVASSTGRQIKISQLYLAPILIDENFTVNSFPAIYLWNQPTTSVNTTPAWETFDIPIIP
jgi:hypothetical protein